MSLALHRCYLLLLTAFAVAASAQQPAPRSLDQKALLTEAREAYYLPIPRGVKGFVCTVSFDWADVLERASGRKIPSREPTLVALKNATVTVTDDIAKGVTVNTAFPNGAPAVNSPVATREKILTNLVRASLSGWNPFLSDQIFPMEGTKYRFEPSPAGYRLTLEGGSFFSILNLDSQFRLTHGESHLNGTATDFTPTFDPSSHGWLITSLKTTTTQAVATTSAEMKAAEREAAGVSSSAGPANETNPSANTANFGFSYQFVDDILVPKHVTVQYAGGLETPYDLTGCILTRTATSAAKP